MARRPQSTSPNKILVIFLVVFILASLGEFIWAYTLLKDHDKWQTLAKDKDDKSKSANQAVDWLSYQRDEMMAAVGVKHFSNKAEVVKNWRDNRASFLKQEKYKNEEGAKEFDDARKEFEKALGYDEGYRTKFLDAVEQLKGELNTAREKLAAKTMEFNAKTQEMIALEKKFNAERDNVVKVFQDGNQKALNTRKEATETMSKALQQHAELAKKLGEMNEQFEKEKTKQESALRLLQDKIKAQEEAAKNPNRTTGEPHALVLDISKGKPLWDTPRGKVVRVEESGKRIYIDKGSKDGVKPGLTFNVFTDWNGRGAGPLKATIEVVRVDDTRMSLCKVNTYFDAEGREIPAYEATPARVFSDGGSTVREGDLLFNLFWGAHVAIAGSIDPPGLEGRSPSAQMDSLAEFMRYLERIGIVVDAHIDLREGKKIGDLTSKTNVIIRGPRQILIKESDDKLTKDTSETIKTMQDRAVEAGMFVISPENFAVVTGFRRPGSADAQQIITFVPRAPAGATIPQGAVPPPTPDTQKKDTGG